MPPAELNNTQDNVYLQNSPNNEITSDEAKSAQSSVRSPKYSTHWQSQFVAVLAIKAYGKLEL